MAINAVAMAGSPQGGLDAAADDSLFAAIASDLSENGFSVQPGRLPVPLTDALWQHIRSLPEQSFVQAGTGRLQHFVKNHFVRNDSICWINGESEAGRQWLEWAAALQSYLNRSLYLGLFSFESHFAHYRPGDFYRRHLDAFKGEANRVLSLVVYFNAGWQPDDGGELVLYHDGELASHLDIGGPGGAGLKITPGYGTIVAFLSEEFPHEVLPACRHRYSIAGWYRLNTSLSGRVDPPS